MPTPEMYETRCSPKIVLALYCCRHRIGTIVKMLDSLYPPWELEVIDIAKPADAAALRDHNVDDWGYQRVVDLVNFWPNARACILVTTAISDENITGKPIGIDSAYGYGDGNFDSVLLNQHSLAKALNKKPVPFPNTQREVYGKLRLFIRQMLGVPISAEERRLLAGPHG